MSKLRESDRITLNEGLALLERHLTTDDARARLRQAFIQRAILAQPFLTFPYEKAEINWTTGAVKIPQRRETFAPTFSRSEFLAYFFNDQDAGLMLPFQFSRRTVNRAIEVIEDKLTQGQITRYILHLGKDFPRWILGEQASKEKRANSIIELVYQCPDRQLDDGKLLRDELVEHAVSLLPKSEWDQSPDYSELQSAFLHALQLDGFTVSDGELRRSLPEIVKLPEAEDEIFRLLKAHRFRTAEGHLRQAFANHTDGNWASANAQIRNFFDGLLDEIAERIDPAAAELGSGQPRRTRLAAQGFLSRSLNEWEDNGLGFINGLVKRLHPQGSHPGLSDPDDSTFRLHIVLIAARLLLVRYDGRAGL